MAHPWGADILLRTGLRLYTPVPGSRAGTAEPADGPRLPRARRTEVQGRLQQAPSIRPLSTPTPKPS